MSDGMKRWTNNTMVPIMSRSLTTGFFLWGFIKKNQHTSEIYIIYEGIKTTLVAA
jgi:hypothetical protein